MKKTLIICLFVALLVLSAASVALAAPSNELPEDPGGAEIPGTSKFTHLAHQVLNFLGTLGIFGVVIALIVQGWRIVFAQDPRARAEAMHSLIPIAVGAFVAFGAKWIAVFIKNFAESI